jgi:hypothetical protein
MNNIQSDNQSIGEVNAVAFSMLQPGATAAYVTMTNEGVNTINYDFQDFNGTTWNDLGPVGSPTYNTIMPGQTISVLVTSPNPQVQLLANASGGAILFFQVVRSSNRASGGQLPLISF